MNKVVVINPAEITAGNAQAITADLTKFDFAKSQVTLVVEKLLPLYKINSDEKAAEALEILKSASDVNKAIEEKRKTLVKPFNDGATSINEYKKGLSADLEVAIAKVKQAVLDYQREKEKKALEERTIARQGQLVQLGFTYNAEWNAFRRENVDVVTSEQFNKFSPAEWDVLIHAITQKIQRLAQEQVKLLQEENEVLDLFGSDDQKSEVTEKIEAAKAETNIQVKPHVASFGSTTKVKGTTKRWTFEPTDTSIIPREYLVIDESAVRKAIQAGVREIPGIRIYQSESLSIR